MLTKEEKVFEALQRTILKRMRRDQKLDPLFKSLYKVNRKLQSPKSLSINWYEEAKSIKDEKGVGHAVERMKLKDHLNLIQDLPKRIRKLFIKSKRTDKVYHFARKECSVGAKFELVQIEDESNSILTLPSSAKVFNLIGQYASITMIYTLKN